MYWMDKVGKGGNASWITISPREYFDFESNNGTDGVVQGKTV